MYYVYKANMTKCHRYYYFISTQEKDTDDWLIDLLSWCYMSLYTRQLTIMYYIVLLYNPIHIFCGFLSIIIGSCSTMSGNLCAAYTVFSSLYTAEHKKLLNLYRFRLKIKYALIHNTYNVYYIGTSFPKMAFHFWVIGFYLFFTLLLYLIIFIEV